MHVFHPFACSCGWTSGSTDGALLHTGSAILTRDSIVRCPSCGHERRWFAARPAKAAGKRRKQRAPAAA
jgi:hypothetical protein